MKLEVISPATWIQKKEREMANLPIRSSRGVDVSANRKSGQTRWRVLLLICSALLFPLERATGEITFLNSWGSTGDKDGEFNNPNGITIGPSGNIYVTDSINHRIQIFSSNGTFIDKFGTFGPGDGEFSFPRDIAIAPISGELYVADQNNHRIQRFDSSNNFISKFGSQGTADGQFDQPHSVAITSTDKVYVADFNNDRIQKFDNDVDDTFLSKFGTTGSGDGNFVSPFNLALTPTDDLYVIDLETSRVQKFDNTDTFVSKFGSTGIGEVEFTKPHGVAVGSQGNLLVVDTDNHRIQKIKSDGTYISQFGSLGTADGQFDEPNGIAVTSTGLIYLTDTGNDRIQRFFDSDAWVSGPYPLSTNLRLDSNEVLGSTFQVDAYRTNLQVPGTLSLAANSVLGLNGGMITADLILVEASATINLDAPFTNASRINLVDPSSRIQGAAFTNQALVYGNGHIAAPWINDTRGEVRASGNDRIVFSAVGNSNAGVMNILGGTVEFEKDLTNTGEVNLLGGVLIIEQR
jgi:sugar lactone lactonase YvrE